MGYKVLERNLNRGAFLQLGEVLSDYNIDFQAGREFKREGYTLFVRAEDFRFAKRLATLVQEGRETR